MAHRQRKWAEEQTFELRFKLGGRCVKCGKKKDLEFDVIVPDGPGDEHHKKEWSWRMSYYRKQFKLGNLQLLCKKHNVLKGNNIPF